MKVAVAGGTGTLGRRVVARLLERGHEVRLLVRAGPGRALPPGADLVVGDLLAADAAHALVAGADVVLHLATALAADAAGTVDWPANDAVRRRGTGHLVAACAAHGVRRLVAQSVAFVEQATPAQWSEGTEALQARPFLASAADLEARVRAAPTPAVVLRGGLFYGAGTSLSGGWQRSATEGHWPVPANGNDYVSLVHVADMAAAVVVAVEGEATGTYAVVDDHPLRWADLAARLAAACGVTPRPGGGPAALGSFRVRNRAFEEGFGWRPAFPSLLVGVAEEPWWQAAGRRHR